jgi:hemerythrin superfamily protein
VIATRCDPTTPREEILAKAKRSSARGNAANNGAGETPDILSLLTADHAEVRAAFDEYERFDDDGGRSGERQERAQRICAMLTIHATIEEEFFYPAAREAGVDPALLDDANVEHASAKTLIAQIEAAGPDERLFEAKLKVLAEYVYHHVQEEEGELFAQVRRSEMDLYQIVMPMATRRAELMHAGQAAGRASGQAANSSADASTGR